jgi:type VI secretion system protein ImpC
MNVKGRGSLRDGLAHRANVRAGKGPARSAAQGRPMRILVLSGCSGWDSQGQPNPNTTLGKSTPVAVDIDNFDEVLARANPSVYLPIGRETGKPIKVAFDSLDDFHPDALYRRLEIFKAI